MSAGSYSINVEQGATFNLLITIKLSDGTLFDLTNWIIAGVSPRGQIRRRKRADDPPLINFSFVISNPASGQITITLPASATAELAAGESATDARSTYVWDFEIENSVTGEVRRVLEGNCYVSAQVTR
jgi:hypothetical protein